MLSLHHNLTRVVITLLQQNLSRTPKQEKGIPKKKLMFASSPSPIQHEETFVEEPKFKSVEVQTDFSFLDTPIYFPSDEEAIVNIDHDHQLQTSSFNIHIIFSLSR